MLDILKINDYIKKNNILEVRNPLSFNDGNITNDGLYSPLIFGNTTQEKFVKYGYINLGTKIIHPFVYKNLKKIKSIFFNITLDKGHKNFREGVIKDGILTEVKKDSSEKGNSGINWLINNWGNIDLDNYKTGKNLDDDNIDKIINAKNFLSAYRTIRQTQLAATDFNLHSDNETKDIKAIYNMTQKTLEEFQLLPISDFQKQHINSFSHIFAGGYASGYYSYKWAEIFSAGTYRFLSTSKRKDEDLLKYKKNILEKGGTINMTEAFKEMTGKNLDIKDLMIVEGII